MGPGANSGGYSRKHIHDGVDASLRRLGTDYIDLYQTHIWRDDTNIEEVIEAFDDLVRVGKVRYVGATDMPSWQFAKLVYTARLTGRASFVSMQCHYNRLFRVDVVGQLDLNHPVERCMFSARLGEALADRG